MFKVKTFLNLQRIFFFTLAIPSFINANPKILPQIDINFSNKNSMEYSRFSLESSILQEDIKIISKLNLFPFLKKPYFLNSSALIDTIFGRLEFGNNDSAFHAMQNSWRNIFTDKEAHLKPMHFSYYSPEQRNFNFGISGSAMNARLSLDLGMNYHFNFKEINWKIAVTSKFFEKKSAINLGILSSYGPYIFSISYGTFDYDYVGISSIIGYMQGPFSVFIGLEGNQNMNAGLNYKFSKYLTPYMQVRINNKERMIISGVAIRL